MTYQILCIGKIKESFYREQIMSLCKGKNVRIEITEFPDEKIPDRLNEKGKRLILEKEGSHILSKLQQRDYVIALCVEGKEITTRQHARLVAGAAENGCGRIVYVIGGSLGLSEAVKRRADQRISFSKMTFPHQLMRMVLCEEIRHMADYL